MIIDVNAYIGHYPFRRTKYKSGADLVMLMDRYGIDKSCVASVSAVYYKDCMEGNRELLDGIAALGDRLIPFCVLNPEYNGARDDFRKCVTELGFKGLRLFPRQQGYRLDGDLSAEMLRIAGEMGIPVHIPILLEDLRGHHHLDISEPIGADEIKRAALLAPETDFVLSNEYLGHYAQTIEPACAGRAGKVYYDIDRVDCLYLTMMEDLVNAAGYGRMVFGTGATLQNMSVQFVKLHYMGKTLGTTPEQMEAVKGGNLARLLGI
jgi:predicted TIM-barrel fold metal-dependent hydrolase